MDNIYINILMLCLHNKEYRYNLVYKDKVNL